MIIINNIVSNREFIILFIEFLINCVLLEVKVNFILGKCIFICLIKVSILLEILIVFDWVWCIIFMLIIGVLFNCMNECGLVGLKYIVVILLICVLLCIIIFVICLVDIDVVLVWIIICWLFDFKLLVGILKGVWWSILVIFGIVRLKLFSLSGLMCILSICLWLLFKWILVILGIVKNCGVKLILMCLVSVFNDKLLFDIVSDIIVLVLLLVLMIDICFIFLGNFCCIWVIDLCVLLVVLFRLIFGWNLIIIWVLFFLFCVWIVLILFIWVIVFLSLLVILVLMVLGEFLGNDVEIVMWGLFILGSLCILILVIVVIFVMMINKFSIMINMGWCIVIDGKFFIIGCCFIIIFW